MPTNEPINPRPGKSSPRDAGEHAAHPAVAGPASSVSPEFASGQPIVPVFPDELAADGIVLRTPAHDDAPILAAAFADPVLAGEAGLPLLDEEQLHALLDEQLPHWRSSGLLVPYAIVDSKTGAILGGVTLRQLDPAATRSKSATGSSPRRAAAASPRRQSRRFSTGCLLTASTASRQSCESATRRPSASSSAMASSARESSDGISSTTVPASTRRSSRAWQTTREEQGVVGPSPRSRPSLRGDPPPLATSSETPSGHCASSNLRSLPEQPSRRSSTRDGDWGKSAILLRSKTKFGLAADARETRVSDPRCMKTTRFSAAAVPIAVERLTKTYGTVKAVDDLSFAVRAGAVTGFLGPNGAGKTTALKVIVGLARPTAGRASINGRPVGSAAADACMLGVYIEPCGAHPGRSARDHLRSGISSQRDLTAPVLQE